jgi:hypothetical protein
MKVPDYDLLEERDILSRDDGWKIIMVSAQSNGDKEVPWF